MATISGPPTKKQPSKTGLNDRQRTFINEYLVCMNAKQAALAAGYSESIANQATVKLVEHPNIKPILAVEMAKREARTEKTGDDVLKFMHNGLFFNPLKYLREGDGNGGFFLSEEQLNEIPDEIGQLITNVQKSTYRDKGGGKTVKYYIQFISKEVILGLLVKHHGLDGVSKHALQVLSDGVQFDYNILFEPHDPNAPDPVEQKIASVIDGKATVKSIEEQK